jgi:DNA-binding transcriptional MerR regulator
VAETRATIPDRELFKAAEVCEIAGVQPYVLRSWELEFPSIGTSRTPGGPRVYRRSDVERILRIKDLVFSEGLTLAGARRRIEEEEAPVGLVEPTPAIDVEAREKLGEIRSGLRALLDMLGDAPEKKAGAWPPAGKPGVLEFDGTQAASAAPAGIAKRGSRKKPAKP